MTTTDTRIDIQAAGSALRSLMAVWMERQQGHALEGNTTETCNHAFELLGLNDQDDITRTMMFCMGFDLAADIAAAILNQPFDPTAEIARALEIAGQSRDFQRTQSR